MKLEKYNKAINTLAKYLEQNPNVAWMYHCYLFNICQESGGTKLKSHQSAAKYMNLWSGIDTSKFPEYQKAIKRDMSNKNAWDNT